MNMIDYVDILDGMYSVELLCLGVSLVSSSWLLYILYRVRAIHMNLKILCINLVVSYLLMVLARSGRLIAIIWYEDSTILLTAHRIAIGGLFYGQTSLLVERTVSTFRANRYENRSCYALPIGLILLMWLIAMARCAVQNLALFDNIMVNFIDLAVNIACAAGHSMLFLINYKRYKQAGHHYCREPVEYVTLSERYQLLENIRTIRLLNYYSCCKSLVNFFIIIAAIARNIFYVQRGARDSFGAAILLGFIDILLAISTWQFPILAMALDGEMRKIFLRTRIFRRRRTSRVSSTSTSASHLRHVRGVLGQMFAVEQTQAEYFVQLEKAWKQLKT